MFYILTQLDLSFEKITLAAARMEWMQEKGEQKISSEILRAPCAGGDGALDQGGIHKMQRMTGSRR